MRQVWAVADAIYSPLGRGTESTMEAILSGKTGVRKSTSHGAVTGSLAEMDRRSYPSGVSFFDYICREVASDAMQRFNGDRSRLQLILSTTKGNIGEAPQQANVTLHESARRLAEHVGVSHFHVISNACISGVLALIAAKRAIITGQADHVLVVGADVLSPFIVSGFSSLHALSPELCRPFDAARNGINLGEGAGAVLLTAYPERFREPVPVEVLGYGLSNDANHISGPSRTGEELALAISKALASSDVRASDIDFVNAHGTATLYNDEMEAKAFSLAGLSDTPVNSLKGYFGHTLGAAGVIETIICMEAIRLGVAVATMGHEKPGLPVQLNVCSRTEDAKINRVLKTASGFGGCNAALVLQTTN